MQRKWLSKSWQHKNWVPGLWNSKVPGEKKPSENEGNRKCPGQSASSRNLAQSSPDHGYVWKYQLQLLTYSQQIHFCSTEKKIWVRTNQTQLEGHINNLAGAQGHT